MTGILIGIAAVVLIPILWISVVRLIWEDRVFADEVHFAATEDGYEVALYRYRPKYISPNREPVILCHGLGANRTCFTPGRAASLARYLVDEGYDVFCLDLRGRGLSSKPKNRRGRDLGHYWTFDDYVQYDLPAAIEYVRRATGSRKINWVGHSMGGMVIYVYLQQHPDGGGVRCATAIASPGNFTALNYLRPIANMSKIILSGRTVPSREFARLVAPFSYIVPYERFGMVRRYLPWVATNCISNTSTGVMRQFAQWVSDRNFCNKDSSVCYLDGYGAIQTPLMTMVGSGDILAHPRDVKFVADRMRSPRHKHVFFSKKLGSIGNYDHNSILMGETAPIEVYPLISDWIMKNRKS